MNFHLVRGFTMRYFIYLAYDGTNYHGWQIQPNGDSVQETLMRAFSTFLRQEIEVVGAGRTDAGVHARLMVAHYVTIRKDPFNRHYAWRLFNSLDFEKMNEAARVLFDYTDFTSFSKLHTDVKTNNCRIMHAEWTQVSGTEWVFTIKADRFLRNMVRAVVGTLVEVGRGKMTVDEFRKVIEDKDRCSAGSSVPGHALFLVDVGYPEELFIVSPSDISNI